MTEAEQAIALVTEWKVWNIKFNRLLRWRVEELQAMRESGKDIGGRAHDFLHHCATLDLQATSMEKTIDRIERLINR